MTAELVDLNLRSWITLSLDRLIFPRRCCRCGEGTAELVEFSGDAKPSVVGVVGQLFGVQRSVTIAVPFCKSCQEKRRKMAMRWTVIGFIIGAAVGTGVAFTFPFEGMYGASWASASRGLSALLGVVVGPLMGHALSKRKDPVRIRNYVEGRRTVQLWFERVLYRDQVKQLIEEK